MVWAIARIPTTSVLFTESPFRPNHNWKGIEKSHNQTPGLNNRPVNVQQVAAACCKRSPPVAAAGGKRSPPVAAAGGTRLRSAAPPQV